MTTGERLSRIMEERGVSVRELARRTGLSLSAIRKLRGSHMVGNLYTWNVIAKALDVSVDDFLKGCDLW